MKYRRLKTLDSTGVPVMRYYKLKDEAEALTNAFYGIETGKVCSKIEGAVGEGIKLIGFSHGGDRLARGLMLLDINTTPVYMGILEEEDTGRPEPGDIVNGYQRVIDTHYDGDSDGEGGEIYGKNDEEWGVETLDNPYYLFTIVQPAGTAFSGAIDDEEAGEVSPQGGQWVPGQVITGGGQGRSKRLRIYISNVGGKGQIKYLEIGGAAEVTVPLEYGQEFKAKEVANFGDALSTVYTSIGMYNEDGTELVENLASVTVTKNNTGYGVEVPTSGGGGGDDEPTFEPTSYTFTNNGNSIMTVTINNIYDVTFTPGTQDAEGYTRANVALEVQNLTPADIGCTLTLGFSNGATAITNVSVLSGATRDYGTALDFYGEEAYDFTNATLTGATPQVTLTLDATSGTIVVNAGLEDESTLETIDEFITVGTPLNEVTGQYTYAGANEGDVLTGWCTNEADPQGTAVGDQDPIYNATTLYAVWE